MQTPIVGAEVRPHFLSSKNYLKVEGEWDWSVQKDLGESYHRSKDGLVGGNVPLQRKSVLSTLTNTTINYLSPPRILHVTPQPKNYIIYVDDDTRSSGRPTTITTDCRGGIDEKCRTKRSVPLGPGRNRQTYWVSVRGGRSPGRNELTKYYDQTNIVIV